MKIYKNHLMKNYSYIKIGGKSKFFTIIESINDIKEAIKFAKQHNIKYKIIGSGSNIFFSKYFDGLVILNKYEKISYLKSFPIKYSKINSQIDIISVSSGTILLDFINKIAENNFNLSELAGIPGTVGGAVYNNAGAYGKEISDYFEGATYLDKNLEIKILNRENLSFIYRSSCLKKNNNSELILLDIFLNIPKSEYNIHKYIDNIISIRDQKISKEPNIGCIFKNIYLTNYKLITGKLLDDIDIKTLSYKNLCFGKHSNIIINPKNNENINPEDLTQFIEIIKLKFFENYGFNLNLEVEKI